MSGDGPRAWPPCRAIAGIAAHFAWSVRSASAVSVGSRGDTQPWPGTELPPAADAARDAVPTAM
jgi:hypothetical protein